MGPLSLWVAVMSLHGVISVQQFRLNFLCVCATVIVVILSFFFFQIMSWQVKREIGFLKVVETSPEALTVAGSRRVSDSQQQGELRFNIQKDFLSGSLGRVVAGLGSGIPVGQHRGVWGWPCRLRSGCWGREGVSPGTSRGAGDGQAQGPRPPLCSPGSSGLPCVQY